jgi:hypothetical protein
MKDRKIKQVLSRGGNSRREEAKKMKEGEYVGYILYSCMKTEQ